MYAIKDLDGDVFYGGNNYRGGTETTSNIEDALMFSDYNQVKGMMVMLYRGTYGNLQHDLGIVHIDFVVRKVEKLTRKDLCMIERKI